MRDGQRQRLVEIDPGLPHAKRRFAIAYGPVHHSPRGFEADLAALEARLEGKFVTECVKAKNAVLLAILAALGILVGIGLFA